MRHKAECQNIRNGYFDALRGLAIIFVVLGHAAAGIGTAGLLHESQRGFFATLNSALYLVHMPVLALLMGVNVPRSLQKRGIKAYLCGRIPVFLYLYLVWSLIQGIFNVLGRSFANSSVSAADIINLLKPQGHLWFLPWAVVAILLVSLLQPWKSAARACLALVLTGALAWIGWGTEGSYFWENGNALYLFLIVGALIGSWGVQDFPQRTAPAYLGVIGILALIIAGVVLGIGLHLTKPTSLDLHKTPESVALGMAASLVSCLAVAMVLALCYRVLGSRNLLEYLGVYSLQIYLAHLLFVPTTRVLLVKVGLDNPFAVLIIATAAGVVCSLTFAKFSERWAPWIYTLPDLLTARVRRTSQKES